MSQYNVITYYDQKFSRIPVHLDASVTGLGGHFGFIVYSLPIPLGFKGCTIIHLQILNIVVAAKIWSNHWAAKKIQIFVNTGRARDTILAICARSHMWLIAAMFNIDFIFLIFLVFKIQ